MMRRALPALLPGSAFALVALVFTSGCASVPRDAGVGEVNRIVAERTGQRLAWQPGQPIAPPDDAPLAARLEGELSVDAAVEIALANNRDLLAALEELGLARADLIAARTVRNPIADGEYHLPGDRFTPYELAVTQTLVDLFTLPRRRALGEAEFQAQRLRVSASVVGFAGQVRVDYHTLQAAQAALAQQQAITAAAAAAVELAQRQHAAGNVSDLDLESEQARYERAKLDLARAELDELQARERLLADLGALRALPLRLPPLAAPPAEPERSAEQVEAAHDQRLDLQLLRAELDAARRARPLAAAEPFDELAAGVHFDRESGGEHSRGPTATIPIPLFDRGLAGRARAAAALRRAELRLHALDAAARSQTRAARERLVEARARAEYLAAVVVPRRQRILHLTQLEYNAMLRGAYDLLRARQELAAAERERVMALHDYWLARTALDLAVAGAAGFGVRAEPPRREHLTLFAGGAETKEDE
jgi:cobalt-zinc-cadmium efflux system outer membrane protein